jgi:hypothetical protein
MRDRCRKKSSSKYPMYPTNSKEALRQEEESSEGKYVVTSILAVTSKKLIGFATA